MPVHPLAAGKHELSDKALRLSQVIEREARRNSRMVRPVLPAFSRRSHGDSETGPSSSSKKQRKKSAAVSPVPDTNALRGATPNVTHLRDGSIVAEIEHRGSKVAQLERHGSKTLHSRTDIGPSPHERRSVTLASTSAMSTTAPPPVLTRQQRLWLLVDDPQSSLAANYISVTIFFFVVVSTIVFIAQTEEALVVYADELDIVEVVCAVVFTIELLVRVIACPSKCRFIRDFANWIDISAIFPFYLERMLEVDNASSFGAIRIVRLTRVARVLKMSRYSSAIQVFVQAIAVSMKALSMLIFLMAIAMIVFSSLIYFAEYTHDGCRSGGWVGDCVNEPPRFASSLAGAAAARVSSTTDCICVDPNPYKSIGASFWWCIVTMSTVGYGDMTPVTLPGKIVGCASVLTGMLVLALPITVIGTNFQKVMKTVMQQTMKSNVDYLRGKRMLCRNEIEAILQRFHAVTEDIHLDVDEVINVYDDDNNGMLEDDELRRFREDLEILQNRFMTSQQNGGGAGSVVSPSAADLADPARSLQNGAAWSLSDAAMQPQRRQYSPAFAPVRHASTSVAVVRYLNNTAHSNDHHHHETQQQQQQQSSPTSAPSSPSSASAAAVGPSSVLAYSTSFDGPSAAPSASTPSSDASLHLPGGLADDSDGVGSMHSRHASRSGEISAPVLPHDIANSELFWLRMLEMQRAWDERLHETETRLEAKLQVLTRMLVRMEGKLEEDD